MLQNECTHIIATTLPRHALVYSAVESNPKAKVMSDCFAVIDSARRMACRSTVERIDRLLPSVAVAPREGEEHNDLWK